MIGLFCAEMQETMRNTKIQSEKTEISYFTVHSGSCSAGCFTFSGQLLGG